MTANEQGAAGAPAERLAYPRVVDGPYPESEHPLETAWTFWVERRGNDRKQQGDYLKGLQQIGTFRTVEEFHRLCAFLRPPSNFPRDYNLLCFRTGAMPMWEEFPDGGSWNHRLRRSSESGTIADTLWVALLHACVGEAFETPNVVGCVLSSRLKEIVLSVWNASDKNDQQVRLRIGDTMRKVLDAGPNTVLEYKENASAIKAFSYSKESTQVS
mmetsp:Transcript_32194/g.75600  ORF Transcript_32194/g.75600 Transcript_32194/m.75600 type:complete len:214 (+) Transcript_32194:135-776(+)|eukprot:CAMPEP_0178428340 /NCGR_PEP_ID=MMETSP0689_2-20121128/30225_1 /TAXON_ID=160604 /ORGANISM="Amphidinium massartii, Strain CS-259" /LENGTH=213 /DNA_ID=CAMNT_0020050105 /DNA_START=62 /DNA_END=703 /DNA_ORIENTATION=-